MPTVAQSAQRASTPPHYVVCVRDKAHVAVKPDTQVLDRAGAGNCGAGEGNAYRWEAPSHFAGSERDQLGFRRVNFKAVVAVPVG